MSTLYMMAVNVIIKYANYLINVNAEHFLFQTYLICKSYHKVVPAEKERGREI
jgi:hypothetical protein